MILVDTSVWIDFFSNKNSDLSNEFETMILNSRPLCINSIIEMEILQGIKNQKHYEMTKRYLQPFLYFKDFNYQSFETAEEIYRSCRKKGITIRKSINCLIAANALENNLTIFHKDRDFSNISKVFPDLQTISR